MSTERIINELWTENSWERSSNGLADLISHIYIEGMRKIMKSHSENSWCPG
jgi:hypothetical protein